MDFTLTTYCKLLKALKNQDYSFLAFEDYLRTPLQRSIILRHDVDALPENSLNFARIEADNGIKGTYYFRVVPESFNERIIKEIYSLGHEIGYHYEDMYLAWSEMKTKIKISAEKNSELEKRLVELAIKYFERNLEKLRGITPVKTICMHGSPLSRWDNKLLWEYYDYRNYEIAGETYLDFDSKNGLYLTDTGRRWDGNRFNIRDKVAVSDDTLKFHSTFDIIESAYKNLLPWIIMFTFHPQRWTDVHLLWIKELFWQNTKNIGKNFILNSLNLYK